MGKLTRLQLLRCSEQGLVVIGIPPIPPNSSASTIVEHRFIWLREYDLILGALPVCWNTETVQQVFFSEKSSHAGFMFYFSSRSPAQTSPHIILIRFLSSPAFTRDIKLYHRRTADMRRVGGDQLRPHYQPEIKTVCIVYTWQDTTQHNWTLRLETCSCYRISQADRRRSSKKVRNLKSMLSSSSGYRQTQILP